MAQSYLHNTSRTVGAAAETAADMEYALLMQTYVFVPIAVETMGAINSDGLEFFGDLGRRITQVTDDIRESAFLFQRLSVLIQRYNAVAIQGTFAHTTSEDEFYAVPAYLFLTFVFFNPQDLYYRGY